jgi:hypothetical protein
MNSTTLKTAAFLLLIMGAAIVIGKAGSTEKLENLEPEVPEIPEVQLTLGEAESYFTPQIETHRKEMEVFFEENKDAFNSLYEYLMEHEFAMVSLTVEGDRYSWDARLYSNEQSFHFFNVDSPVPQTLDLLVSDGMSELDFYESYVTISYPRIMGTDQFASCYIEMFYRRRESPEQEHVSANIEIIAELSDNWTIARYLLVNER